MDERSPTVRHGGRSGFQTTSASTYFSSVTCVSIFFTCTDKEMVHIGKLSQVDTLSLAVTQISDAGLEQLAGLGRLRVLNLWGNQVTDAGLVHLSGLTRLRGSVSIRPR